MKTLFLVLDTVRRDYLTAYGNTWVQTPNLTWLAERGVVFDNHWVGSLPCMPARREFMTGRYNFLDRGWGPIEPYDDVLPIELRKAGVFSHFLTDHYHYYELGGENYHTAFDTWEFFRGQENDPWISLVDAVAMPEHLGQQTQVNRKDRLAQQREEDFSGPKTAQAAVEWLHANRDADNWFLQVELFDPHEPFYCTDKYRDMYGDTWNGPLFDWPTYGEVQESPEAVEHVRKCYAGLLTMTDYWCGKVLDALDELGLREDTMIVFTTDHGTMLAEHRYWMKNDMPLYNEIVRIPLVIGLPYNAHAGTRISALTQTIDVMPTILDAFGCTLPPHVQGYSLLRAIDGETLREDCIFGYFGKATNVTDGQYVYMRNPINEDAGPLHAYTAMPIQGLRSWFPRELNERMEMRRYFGHTYNMPLYKIPAKGAIPLHHADEAPFVARHQLFDILADPQEAQPITDAAREAHFVQRIVTHLAASEAPDEQYARLGITPPTQAGET